MFFAVEIWVTFKKFVTLPPENKNNMTYPDLPNGIVRIEVNEYDDKDISDELAEAIIKEFKVVELLDVE